MRRRPEAVGAPLPELVTFNTERWAPPDAECDPRAATKAHQEWCAAREAWAAVNSWPTGDQRAVEEAIVTPDEPFDGSLN